MKKVLIVIVVFLVIFIVVGTIGIFYFNKEKNNQINEVYTSTLKYAKCLRNCPFETVGGEDMPLQECVSACGVDARSERNSFLEIVKGNDIDKKFINSFQKCLTEFYSDSERLPVCLDRFVNDYSSYGEVSKYRGIPIYSNVEILIDSLNCDEKNVEIDIIINKGSSLLREIVFQLEGKDGESRLIIINRDIVQEGVVRDYSIDLLLEEVNFEVDRVKVGGVLLIDETFIFKDVESC